MTLDETDALIGFGKPASKTADWIVNTYLPNAPVSYRLSIEHAIATAIVEASRAPEESVPAALPSDKLRGLVRKWREDKDQKHHGHVDYWHGVHDALYDCAQEVEALLSQEPGEDK